MKQDEKSWNVPPEGLERKESIHVNVARKISLIMTVGMPGCGTHLDAIELMELLHTQIQAVEPAKHPTHKVRDFFSNLVHIEVLISRQNDSDSKNKETILSNLLQCKRS